MTERIGNSEHRHGQAHGLTQGEELRGVSDGRLLWAVVINQLLTVAQVAAGIISGSVALLGDAAHNFNDANALLIAYIARRFSRRKADDKFTFGYGRAEVVGAMINLTLLAAIGLYLVSEAISRFVTPEPIEGRLMAITSILAIVIDFATAWMLWSMSKGSLNVRAAFVHNIVDAIGSIGVLLGSIAILLWEWYWIDPLITLMIAGYVLYQVIQMLPQAVRILMNGTPPWIQIPELIASIESVEGVADVRHVHVWQIDENHAGIEAHLALDVAKSLNHEQVKSRVRNVTAEQYRISHSTLEIDDR
ncbi:cation diffusion facilitator family transporter [Bremerella sp. T1]|uniref:cation diffusion facilitator family transporter n=1 Tax=unclassified Bremerella TaxID=2795601 RepID=UPI001CCCB571|nr:cation diffusion facilitator family transporter [Bremerella volcania]UBM36359.1 cation diffusion facilitator family transporter [Bremerella volcania]